MSLSYESQLRGRTVIDSGGRALGEVDGLAIDPLSWRVDAIRVRLRKDVADELGLARSTFRPTLLDINTQALQGVGDTVLLRVGLDALKPAPAEPGAHAP